MIPFPWDEAMRLGFGILRLAPRDFWALTPRELAAIAAALAGVAPAPLSRSVLETLMKKYPDGAQNA